MVLNKRQKKIRDKYIALIQSAVSEDPEIGHAKCDDVLCDLLQDLGFAQIVEIYRRQIKWYS